MSFKARLKADLKKISGLTHKLPKEAQAVIEEVTTQLADYEKKVRQFAKAVDLKGRKAKERGRKQVDNVVKQIHHTRSQIEDKVMTLVAKEGKKLNTRVNKLLNRLLSAAQAEQKAKKPRKRKSTARKAPTKKTEPAA